MTTKRNDRKTEDRQFKRGSPKQTSDPDTMRERDRETQEFEAVRRHLYNINAQRWKEALAHKRQMRSFSVGTFDPGMSIADSKGSSSDCFFVPDNANTPAVRWTANPDDHASLGFVGCFAEVESKERFTPGILVLRFAEERLGDVNRETLRLFRWNETAKHYRKVQRSGVNEKENYVWGWICFPGRYAIIGLNSEPLVVRFLGLLQSVAGLIRVGDPPFNEWLQRRLSELLLRSPQIQRVLEAPNTRREVIASGWSQGFPEPRFNQQVPHSQSDIYEASVRLTNIEALPEFQLLTERDCTESGWSSVGPVNTTGCIKQIVIDPNNRDRLYAGASNGGLWVLESVSSYPRLTWKPITDANDSLVTNAFAIATSDSDILYLADGLGFLLRSSNRGLTWTRTSNQNIGNVRKILIHPLTANKVLVAASSGFWRSVDGGITWDSNPGQTTLNDGDMTDAAMDPDNSDILYIGKRYVGVLKSSDFGQSWQLVLNWNLAQPTSGSMIKIGLGRQGNESNRVVAVKFAEEIFINYASSSGTGGGPWASKGKPGDETYRNGYGDWCHVIAVDPSDNDLVLAGAQELFRTADGGTSWQKVIGAYAPHEDQQSIAFDLTQPGIVYIANDGGVFRSTDSGATWMANSSDHPTQADFDQRRTFNYGLVTAQFFHVGAANGRALGNVYHSGKFGSTLIDSKIWEGVGGHGWENATTFGDPKRPTFFYIFTRDVLSRQRYPETQSADDFILRFGDFHPTAIGIDTRGVSTTLLVGSDNPGRVMRALDGDLSAPTWVAEGGINVGNEAVVSIAFASSNSARAYAISQSGSVFRKSNVNAQGDWEYRGRWNVSNVLQIVVNSMDENEIYALATHQVARSIDGGATWTLIAGAGATALPNSPLVSIVASPIYDATIYVGAEIGVFVTNDDGQNWYPFDDGLPNAQVEQILWSGSAFPWLGGFLYVATHGRGLWRRHIC